MYVLIWNKWVSMPNVLGRYQMRLWSVRIERRVQAVITAEGFYSKH